MTTDLAQRVPDWYPPEDVMEKGEFNRIRLEAGSHDDRENGVCAMEFVAMLAREGHSHLPCCASPILADYVILVNDLLAHGPRQELKRVVWDLTRTQCPECEERRLGSIITTILRTAVLPRLRSERLLQQAGLGEQALETESREPAEGRRQLVRTAGQIDHWAEGSDIGEDLRGMTRQAAAAVGIWKSAEHQPDLHITLNAAHGATLRAVQDPAEWVPLLLTQIQTAIGV